MTALIFCVCALAQDGLSAKDLSKMLEAARAVYDVNAAQSARDQIRAQPESPFVLHERVVAALLVAELHRIDWEQLPESDIAHRRPLGEKIDEAAEDGLAALEKLPQDSEYFRMRADLLGVMIRSDFRAKKYRKDMEASAAKAVELDPNNARAYVSQAKPFVFAKENEGGDPAKAIELLSKALELDSTLEPARCLRGLAYQKAGKNDLARADWNLALEKNPQCKPAVDELKKLDRK